MVPPLSSLSDPTSLAKIQILLVPVHPISQASYEHYSSLFRRHTTLRGDEVRRTQHASSHGHARAQSIDVRSRFLPASSNTSISKAVSSNHIHLVWTAAAPEKNLYPLTLLRLAMFPLVVIGITSEDRPAEEGYRVPNGDNAVAESSTSGKMATELASRQFNEVIRSIFPSESALPLVRRLVVVPPGRPTRTSPSKSPVNGFKGKGKDEGDVRYAPGEMVDQWVGHLVGEVIGEVMLRLGELVRLRLVWRHCVDMQVSSLETPAGLKILSSTLLPSVTPALSHLLNSTSAPDLPRRVSTTTPTLPHQPEPPPSSSRSATPTARIATQSPAPSTTSTTSSTSNPFRRSTAISSTFSRTPSSQTITTTSNLPSASSSRYTTAPLSGTAGGRLLKLLGDCFLLVGLYTDAIRCYDDGADRCRLGGDVLWEALAREGRAVSAIGEAWEGRDGSVRCPGVWRKRCD